MAAFPGDLAASEGDPFGPRNVFEACVAGDAWLVDRWLRAGMASANDEVPRTSGTRALHLATAHGRLHVVETLVEHGADVDLGNNTGVTPLMVAVLENVPFGVFRRLLLAGATVARCNAFGENILHVLAARIASMATEDEVDEDRFSYLMEDVDRHDPADDNINSADDIGNSGNQNAGEDDDDDDVALAPEEAEQQREEHDGISSDGGMEDSEEEERFGLLSIDQSVEAPPRPTGRRRRATRTASASDSARRNWDEVPTLYLAPWIVRWLHRLGMDVNKRTDSTVGSKAALHYALASSPATTLQERVLRELVRAGGDMYLLDGDGYTPADLMGVGGWVHHHKMVDAAIADARRIRPLIELVAISVRAHWWRLLTRLHAEGRLAAELLPVHLAFELMDLR